ncbi:MAG: GNAT family N-acetyltransferase [bacterium]
MFDFLPRPHRHDSVHLVSERLTLRPLALDDAEDMLLFARDPEVTRYLPWSPNADLSTVRTFLRDQVNRRRRNESLGLAVVLRATNAVIGSTDLMELKRIPGEAELGYILARPYWGQGMMTESARLTLAYGFSEMALSSIHAWADEENFASRKVLQKIGMAFVTTEQRVVKGDQRTYVRYQTSAPHPLI